MALSVPVAAASVGPRRRLVEWGLMALLVLSLVVLFLHQTRDVQAQAEGAAVKRTLAGLRTAMTLDYLRVQAGGQVHGTATSVAVSQRNPFELLDRVPTGYVGEKHWDVAASIKPGSWFFDRACPCVGYLPAGPPGQFSAEPLGLLQFRLVSGSGPIQLVADRQYLWQGQPLE